MTKRLFLFAAYDKNNVIDDTVVHYVKHLSSLGDVIFVMDNHLSQSDQKKISDIDNVLHIITEKHNEYDFGSYKRGYIWAYDNKLLKKYDWLYLVNDSVYGPLSPLNNILSDLESRGVDEVGLLENTEENHPAHIQSWFLGVSKNIFTQPFFDEFMRTVKHEDDKWDIITKYEVRLSRLILRHGYQMSAFLQSIDKKDIEIYQKPLNILANGVPFVKKASLGLIGGRYLLNSHTDFPDIIDQIYRHAVKNNYINTNTSNDIKTHVKIFRLTLLSIPIVTIYKKFGFNEYKVCIFDKIPIVKIIK
jgi:lipopolysaccharide biosynthesis protein